MNIVGLTVAVEAMGKMDLGLRRGERLQLLGRWWRPANRGVSATGVVLWTLEHDPSPPD